MTLMPGIAVVFVAVLGASFVSTGCWWRKAKASPAPAVIVLPPAPEPSKPEPLPAPPKVESGEPVSSLPASPIDTPIEPPKPFEQPKPPRTTPRPAAPPPQPPPQETPPAEIPQLVPLLTPAEQERYTREISDFIRRAEDNLTRIGERKLDQRQRDNVLRARTFIRQAQDLRQSDLLTARSLAQRADVLAQDVASTVR